MKTKIILQKDVANLGVAGDAAEVAPGYARNYLLPRGFAVPASARHAAKWDARRQELAEENRKKLAAAQEQAKKIQQIVCTISGRAGEDGKLFGSVTTAQAAKSLADQGFPLDRRSIEFREVIKTTGEYTALARLHPQVRASFKVKVVPA
ncbi:MAG: 50S ribosomal protein L9 [Elusimicrobiota bacterium]|jgi:large subunit ribosomal protein L9